MDRFYPSNAEDAKCIRAVILSDDVMMIRRYPMEIMWNREKVPRRVQNTPLRMLIAVLTIVFIGKNRAKWAMYKVLHSFDADGKLFGQNYFSLWIKQGRTLRPSKHGTVSLQM